MYSVVTTVNNTVLHTWKLLREWFLNALTSHTQMVIMWGDGGIN